LELDAVVVSVDIATAVWRHIAVVNDCLAVESRPIRCIVNSAALNAILDSLNIVLGLLVKSWVGAIETVAVIGEIIDINTISKLFRSLFFIDMNHM
jgi:hypothetical protein